MSWIPKLAIALVSSAPAEAAPEAWSDRLADFAQGEGMQTAARIVAAIVLFVVGWIVARLISAAVFHLLGRTTVDNIIAEKLGINLLLGAGKPAGAAQAEGVVERFLARVVFWILILLVVVGVLDFAGLQQMASPIEGLVDTVIQALPRIGKAVLILLGAWVAGRILQIALTGVLERAQVDRKVAALSEDGAAKDARPLSQATGTVVFWLLVFFGIAGAFDALEIEPLAGPLRNAVDQVVSVLPRVGIAALIVVAGYVAGRIARAAVRNVLQSLGFDRVAVRLGLDRLSGATAPSEIVGIGVMAFVVLQSTIAALNKLELTTLSGPLTAMMTQFWTLLPTLAVSVAIIAVGVVLGRLLRRVVVAALKNLGLDRLMARLGFGKLPTRDDRLDEYSEMIGLAAQLAVILLAVAQAFANVSLDTWAGYVATFVAYALEHVLVAVVIALAGFALGNWVRAAIRARRGDEGGPWLAELARHAVLVFAVTMAVRQLEVAEDFVLLTFGLSFGALCLAAGLAFGLGGREVAGEIVRRRYEAARAELAGERVERSSPIIEP